MTRIVKIPDDLPAYWPDHWTGSTRIDCGDQGSFLTYLLVSGHPNEDHVANFRLIINRWGDLWPRMCKTLTETFKCQRAIRCPGAVLEMTLPSVAIDNGAAWYVNFRFYKDPGAWTVSFIGWEIEIKSSGYGHNA